MNGKGQLIPEEETLYVWMDSYGAGPSDNNEFKVQISPVLNTFSWTKFLDVALPVFNINFLSISYDDGWCHCVLPLPLLNSDCW